MKKFRNYSFWVSLTSAVLILIQSISKIFGFEVENDLIENLIMSICGVLVVFGIVVAPNKTENTQNEQVIDENYDSETTDEESKTD